MLLVDSIVLGVLLLSTILSFAFTKFKGNISRVLFINLICYPIASIVTIIIANFVKENFALALMIDFVYSLLIVVPITLIIIGVSYIIKKH